MRLVATMPLLGLLGMRPVIQPARRAAQALGGRVRMMSADFEPAQLTCVPEWLEARVQSALVEAYGDEYANTDPLITPATKAEFGDYQCNVAMSLAKRLKSSPRDVAATIVAAAHWISSMYRTWSLTKRFIQRSCFQSWKNKKA